MPGACAGRNPSGALPPRGVQLVPRRLGLPPQPPEAADAERQHPQVKQPGRRQCTPGIGQRDGGIYSDGTFKFLKLQIGSVDTSSSDVPISTTAQNSGYWVASSSQSNRSDFASSPRNRGNNANPAPAGAGTPVKKLYA